jgi:glycosyltransferase involved in cell wall biosynthesis
MEGLAIEFVPALGVKKLFSRHHRQKPMKKNGVAEKKNKASSRSAIEAGGSWKSILTRWFAIPDQFILWAIPALPVGRKWLKGNSFDLIYATMPPRSNLVLGAWLSRMHRIPLVVEYRDLWTDSPYVQNSLPTSVHRCLHRWLERSVFKCSSRITGVCKGIQGMLAEKAKSVHSAHVGVNYNFFDPRCYGQEDSGNENRSIFTMVYVGSLYQGRHPAVFFEGLKRFVDKYQITPGQVRFDCIGKSHRIGDVQRLVDEMGLSEYVNFVGQVSHQEAIHRLCNAAVSLIVQAPNDTIHIPGKLFEAFGARTPVLLVAPPCEAADILTQCSAGVVCGHSAESIAQGIDKIHTQWKTGVSWPFNDDAINDYSLDETVVSFENVLKSACRK